MKSSKWFGFVSMACLSLGLSNVVHADTYFPSGIYLLAGGGYSFYDANLDLKPESAGQTLRNDDLNKGNASYMGGIGYQLPDYLPLRMDLTFVHRARVDYNQSPIVPNAAIPETLNSQIKTNSGFATFYYDFHLTDYFIPYVGAGAGYTKNEVDVNATPIAGGTTASVNKTKQGFAWQIALGFQFKIINNVFGDVGARHVDLGRAQWGPWGPNNWQINTHDLNSEEGYLALHIFFGDQTPYQAPSLINDDVIGGGG